MKYESSILKRLIDTYGVVGNHRYISEIIKEFIVRGKECFPNLFTYQSDWLAHIDEFGLNPSYTVSYTGQSIYTPNTLERPVKSAILKVSTKYRDIDTGEVLDTFDEGRNLELVSVKMPVLTTTGKNLLNLTSLSNSCSIRDGGYYIDVTPNKSGGNYNLFSETLGLNAVQKDVSNFIKLKPNTTYTLSKAKESSITLTGSVFDIGGNRIAGTSSLTPNVSSRTFTTTEKGIYFAPILSTANSNETTTIVGLQLEEGSTRTTYEPFKSNILTVNEDVILRGIGDVKDTLDCLTGEVTERIGEIVLDGSETWREWSTTETSYGFALWNTLKDFKPRTVPICNALLSYNFNDFSSKDKGVALYTTNTSSYSIFIRLPKTECTGLEDFKTKIQTNPITVQYELATESIKTVDLTILDQNGQSVDHLKSFNGGTHVYTSSLEGSLVPSVDISVVTNLEETLKICSLEGNTM